jgi:hypothetical protein
MMADEHDPLTDLKEGLGLLFRAAKGAAHRLPTDKLEGVAKDAAKEVGRAIESLGNEIDKLVGGSAGKPDREESPPESAAKAPPDAPPPSQPEAPATPRGPRIG